MIVWPLCQQKYCSSGNYQEGISIIEAKMHIGVAQYEVAVARKSLKVEF
jgi:hypothetical protein